MKLTHVTIAIPKGGEEVGRRFYVGLLGLKEIPKPEIMRVRGGLWLDAGGLDVHLSVEDVPRQIDGTRHFGLDCPNLVELRERLTAAGIKTDDGKPAPWKRFYVHDPFGNHIEIHEPGGLRF